MEIDREEHHLVNGSLMKKYAGQVVHLWLNIAGNTSTGGRKVNFTKLRNYNYSECFLLTRFKEQRPIRKQST